MDHCEKDKYVNCHSVVIGTIAQSAIGPEPGQVQWRDRRYFHWFDTNTKVRGVPAAGQIWVIRDLSADVKQDGNIRVDGRGLLLGAGDVVGSNGNASVFATLFCANDGNVQHSSNPAGVPLEVDGDFRIEDTLSPAPPSPCTSPVLLIRVTGTGVWFAAGIPKQ